MKTAESCTIRMAQRADAIAVARIYSEAILARDSTMVLDPVSAQEMAGKIEAISNPEALFVACDAGGVVVGWGIVKMYSDRPGYRLTCETSLFIDQPYRGKGLGTLLQKSLLQHAKKAGFHHVIVRIWAQNESSIALHKNLGFTMVGVQNEIGHVDSKWIDVAVMQCLL